MSLIVLSALHVTETTNMNVIKLHINLLCRPLPLLTRSSDFWRGKWILKSKETVNDDFIFIIIIYLFASRNALL